MNGSFDNTMDMCSIPQHDVPSKKLTSELISDKCVDESSNSMSDNVSNSSNDYPNSNDVDFGSENSKNCDKVPNSINVSSCELKVPGVVNMNVTETSNSNECSNKDHISDIKVIECEKLCEVNRNISSDVQSKHSIQIADHEDKNGDHRNICELQKVSIKNNKCETSNDERNVDENASDKTSMNKEDCLAQSTSESSLKIEDELHKLPSATSESSQKKVMENTHVDTRCNESINTKACSDLEEEEEYEDEADSEVCNTNSQIHELDGIINDSANLEENSNSASEVDPLNVTIMCSNTMEIDESINSSVDQLSNSEDIESVEDPLKLGENYAELHQGNSSLDISEKIIGIDEDASKFSYISGRRGNVDFVKIREEKIIGVEEDSVNIVSIENEDCGNTDNENNSECTMTGNEDNESVHAFDKQNDADEGDPKSDYDSAGKIKKARKNVVSNLTPRRSSRNLNKQKSYIEKEDDPDIQEISPVDPLACHDPLRDDKETNKSRNSKKTIVVNDTKRLVEIAAGTKHMKGKKEPTLVIIDTNSILSGKGPIPLSQPQESSLAGPSTSPYSVLPVALPAQGMYPRMSNPVLPHHRSVPQPAAPPPQPQILPTLTDDMYVVEAPSFIVPYVYEKPPIKPLKEFIEKLGKQIEKEKLEKEKSKAKLLSSEQSKDNENQLGNNIGQNQSTADVPESNQNDLGKDAHGKTEVEDENCDTKESSGSTSDVLNKENEKTDDTETKNIEKDKEKNSLAKLADKLESLGKVSSQSEDEKEKPDSKDDEKSGKHTSYFENPLGKFFMQIGVNLVQEYVQTDLLRSQKRKRDREGGKTGKDTQFAINSLLKNLELSKENNEPFHLEQKKCEYCTFKTESSLVMAQHLETPHIKNYVYRCNFCPFELRSAHEILLHMVEEHNVRGRLERAPAFHQCPNCPFEDNQKGKLTRHLISCSKKHKPEKNQEPPPDWEPPAKIPRVSRNRPSSLGLGAAAYQAAMAQKAYSQHPLLPKLIQGSPIPPPVGGLARGRGRPPLHSRYYSQDLRSTPTAPPQPRQVSPAQLRQGMLYRQSVQPSQSQVLLPATYQISGNQIYQMVPGANQMMPMMPGGVPSIPRLTIMPQGPASSASSTPSPVALVPNLGTSNNSITIQSAHSKNPAAKLLQQPSISITPLPRQASGISPGHLQHTKHTGLPGHPGVPGSKATFVICEICDGYIKDLEQLRNHMQWIHKVKIHPKMIYNRPPLNCQKCQFRFFTDQGLERHLLGSHGLVTSSMQEASNKGKDSGRCPVCGRVYQWKLLNHVARDHGMTLKPAHLSYKCTVCTATFGMYKQFENHVYSAHSVVAKRVVDKKSTQSPRSQANDTLLKPLKINDEITIIPQPARPRPGPASRTGAISAAMQLKNEKVYACERCEATYDGPLGYNQYIAHIKRRHLRRCNIKLCKLEECPTCRERHTTQSILDFIDDHKAGVDVIELSDDEVVIAGQGRNEITITKVPCAPGPKRFKHKLQQRNNVQVIELEDSPVKPKNVDENSRENGEDSLTAVKERLRRRKSLEISQVDSECSSLQVGEDLQAKKRRRLENE